MERYVYVNSIDDLKRINPVVAKIGEGSEGEAFLTQNNQVLKVNDGFAPEEILDSDKDKVIMAQDFDLESYLFPKQLYLCDGVVVGYLSNYFGKNIIQFHPSFSCHEFKTIDYDKLLEAREKMIEDTRILSKEQINIYDLCFNLLFDGNKLGAIDTIGYYKDPNITFDANVRRIDYSLANELNMHNGLYSDDPTVKFDPNIPLEENIKRIRKK